MSSEWKGSSDTMEMVAEQIEERFGEDAVENYDPQANCFTYKGWIDRGYQVKKGQKALQSITWVPIKDKTGQIVKDEKTGKPKFWQKKIALFYVKQVEKVK